MSENSPAMLRQRLFDVEMRISILQTKLGEAETERDRRRRRRQPTRMVDTIVEIIAGDLGRLTLHRREMLSRLEADGGARPPGGQSEL